MASIEKEASSAAEQSKAGSEDSDFGTQDAREMHTMGKEQQLRRNFEYWSILAFSTCTMTTWSGQLLNFIVGLLNGGPEGLVIAFFVTWSAMAAIVATLAELMSMWPTSGGQYHWTYTLAPPKAARFLSYLCGWLSVLAWQSILAAGAFLIGTFVQGLIALNNPSYVEHRWQGVLLAYATLALAIVANTAFGKWLHKIEWAVLIIYVMAFLIILVALPVLAPHKASAHEVFQVFINGGNWSSSGVSWFVGLQGIVFAWIGADGAIHMAEECRDASKTLPWSLMASVLINGIMSFAILIVVLFCGGNLVHAALDGGEYPIFLIFTNAAGSLAGGVGLSVVLLITLMSAALSVFAATTRELWAFARDNGLPASGFLKVVHKGFKLPFRCVLISALFTMLLNLIQLGSDVALNAVVSLTVSAYMSSYLLPFGLILYRRIQAIRGKGKELPWGPWTLGKWTGPLINIYALMWVLLIMVWSFFPPAVDPTPVSMNWSSTVYGAVVIFALVFWFIDGRKRYQGPVRDAAGGAIEPVMGWLSEKKEVLTAVQPER